MNQFSVSSMEKYACWFVAVSFMLIFLCESKAQNTQFPCNNDTIELNMAEVLYLNEGDNFFVKFDSQRTAFYCSEDLDWYMDIPNAQNLGSDSIFVIETAGTYKFVKDTDILDCSDRQVFVRYLTPEYFDIGDYILPWNSDLIISAPVNFKYFSWSTGTNGPETYIYSVGNYSLSGQSLCGYSFDDDFIVHNNQQSGLFAAGILSNTYSVVNLSPEINYPSGQGNDNPHRISDSEMFFDLDNDSVNDVLFKTETNYGSGGGIAYLSVECANDYQIFVDASGKYAGVVNEYEVITNKQNWSDQKINLRFLLYNDCVTLFDEPLWAEGESKYIAFRKPGISDTAYAWIQFDASEIGDILSYSIIDKAYYSTINSIHDVSSIVSIYPNPTSERTNIVCSLPGLGNYEIFSSNGEMISDGVIASEKTEIVLEGLPTGVYYICVDINGARIYSKIIKL